ncbi:lantibiotic dehydratase [Hamadaea sp. NPDC051192]|uniref:lantibiotic dehydratase n=1 Tax=Hamadaea sp. NPDC051192 TaxID=3154940 RepID=UPI0034320123
MPATPSRLRPRGPVLVRASTAPGDLDLDLADIPVDDGLPWLHTQWARPQIRESITLARPNLARRIGQLLAHTRPDPADVRRAVATVGSYLLRWQKRSTPFGLFAAVTTARIGPATATIGDRHSALARVDAEWIAAIIQRLEQDHDLRCGLHVIADSGGFVRDGRYVIAARPTPGASTPGRLRHASIARTPAVRLALSLARTPTRFDQLTTDIAAAYPSIAVTRVQALLHGLVDGGFLITNLRPPTTAVDPLAHLLDVLAAAPTAGDTAAVALAGQLQHLHDELTRHNHATDPHEAGQLRVRLAEAMAGIEPSTQHQLAVDLRLDADITIPQRVIDDATDAAHVLLRLSTQPFGSAAWLDYHARFRRRYGPGALVPVRDLVADSGLGYPTGYLGAPRARPAWRAITERDVYLLALIQQAMIDGTDEIVLTDADIERLTVGDHTTAVSPPRVEMGFVIQAASLAELERGHYTLQITGVPRVPTSMAGRFAHLLGAADRQNLIHSYTADGQEGDDPLVVQLSFPPRRVHNDNVVRVGRLLPDVVALSEYPDMPTITVDDLAVTADAEQMYLVHLPTGRRAIPHIPHALDIVAQTPPLARFLAEVADARSAVFGPFDHGPGARNLPYIPRIRHRRTILTPARWLLTAADLTATADVAGWSKALDTWRTRWHVPARVVVCDGELRQPLDLEQPFDRQLLRTRLARAGRLELREDAPESGFGWIDRPTEFQLTLVPAAPPSRPLPTTAPAGRTLYPGASDVLHMQLVGNPAHFDHILTEHLPRLIEALIPDGGVSCWWVRRHRDAIRVEADQHLSVFLRLTSPAAYGAIAAKVGQFAAGLTGRGLSGNLRLAAYHEHPGRYGHGPAQQAIQLVSFADTEAAICQLRAAAHVDTATGAQVWAQALAAASMTRIAAALADNAAIGYRALLTLLHPDSGPAARILTDLARTLADPADDHHNLRALPGGATVADAWQARDIMLRAYQLSLRPQREPLSVLRTLLHEHHMRAVGLEPSFERATNHAARTAALLCLARIEKP